VPVSGTARPFRRTIGHDTRGRVYYNKSWHKLLAITSQILAKEGNHLQEGNLRIKQRSAFLHILGGFDISEK